MAKKKTTILLNEDKYAGKPVMFMECKECGINYEYGNTFFLNEERTCIYCQEGIDTPFFDKDFILEQDYISIEPLINELFGNIDED